MLLMFCIYCIYVSLSVLLCSWVFVLCIFVSMSCVTVLLPSPCSLACDAVASRHGVPLCCMLLVPGDIGRTLFVMYFAACFSSAMLHVAAYCHSGCATSAVLQRRD